VIWGPFLLALALGLLVSAGLYFAYLWPQVEPEDPVPAPAPEPTEESAKPEPAEKTASDTGDAKVEPAPDKPADEEPQEPPPSAA